MKILRTIGESYTVKDGALRRGLEAFERAVEPTELAGYLKTEPRLVLRQTVSVLDKILRKPRSLKCMTGESYVHRTHLATILWTKLCQNNPEMRTLEAEWMKKVHPYAQKECSFHNPETDENFLQIEKWKNADELQPWNIKGRWHGTFWKLKEDRPDYDSIADDVLSHLFKQEIKITVEGTSRDRIKLGHPSKVGLIGSRAVAMVSSTNDPRIGKLAIAESKGRVIEWDEAIEVVYFRADVAKAMANGFKSALLAAFEVTKASTPAEHYRWDAAKYFGSGLFDHFGNLGLVGTPDKKIWALHNAVRDFYKTLGKSEKLNIACRKFLSIDSFERKDGERELGFLIPNDSEDLLNTLRGKKRNIDVNELIRLGKLVVHASDFSATDGLTDVQLNENFQKRLDFLATSKGQNEIKHNEAFTRSWRKVIGLSLESMQAWTTTDNDRPVLPESEDIADKTVSVRLASGFTGPLDAKFKAHAPILFGTKLAGEQSRTDVVLHEANGERLWAFLRIAAELRNIASHPSSKNRFLKRISNGILSVKPENELRAFAERKNNHCGQKAQDCFEALLHFDIKLLHTALTDLLTQIDVYAYLNSEQLAHLVAEANTIDALTSTVAPRFLKMAQRAKDLAKVDGDAPVKSLAEFAKLDLATVDDITQPGVNSCRVGLLRLLYESGFRAWLGGNPAVWSTCVSEYKKDRKTRAEAYQSNRAYKDTDSFLDAELDRKHETFDAFLASLHAFEAAQGSAKRAYVANRSEQSDEANGIEKFKREVFARLFMKYLEAKKLSWVWTISELQERTKEPVEVPAHVWEIKVWQAQFYAWLYTVPKEHIAMLQHHFRKMNLLDKKQAGQTENDTLAELDRLMGLYVRVVDAGFAGTEHIAGLRKSQKHVSFFENAEDFGKLFSDQEQDKEYTYERTRRGLRQILRFNHLPVLQSIYKKHQISSAEVQKVVGSRTDESRKQLQQAFTDRKTLHDEIVLLCKDKKTDQKILLEKIKGYTKSVTTTVQHDFDVNAVTLRELVWLHDLMMRVVSRLLDFTLRWERDRAYLFLGMLYRQIGSENFALSFKKDRDGQPISDMVCIKSVEQLKSGYSMVRAELHKRYRNAGYDRLTDESILPVWFGDEAIELGGFDFLLPLLNEPHRALFKKDFVALNGSELNPLDRGEKGDGKRYNGKSEKFVDKKGIRNGRAIQNATAGKHKIRNDFAHFNVLRNSRVNLTYLTNAVRGLLSYDRKMKNAVSASISDLLEDDHIVIEWVMDQDRLCRPTVTPRVLSHLSMLPKAGDAKGFRTPMSSVRYTSMVKALFDFDRGGNRLPIEVEDRGEKKIKRDGCLAYPQKFIDLYRGGAADDLVKVNFPKL